LRAELLELPTAIGRIDPLDNDQVVATTTRLDRFLDLLDDHAEHEEAHIGGLIARSDVWLAQRVEDEHRVVEATMDVLRRLADALRTSAPETRRTGAYRLYLTASRFVSEYLAHLSTEDVEIMPMLAATVSIDELLDVNDAIVQSVPPDRMDEYLGHMVPAQNALDRTEMYLGMRTGAPPEAFDHLIGLADRLLDPTAALRLRRELESAPLPA
jgi:hemerythrin-like domain-containing protein